MPLPLTHLWTWVQPACSLLVESFSHPRFYISPVGVITEGDQLNIRCTIQVTHLVQSSPEIIIQKDKAIVAHKMHGNEAIYSVMAMVEHSGNYTCKVEASRISKVNSIMVNITGRTAAAGCVNMAGSSSRHVGIKNGQRGRILLFLLQLECTQVGVWCSRGKVNPEPVSS